MYAYIYSILITGSDGSDVWTEFSPGLFITQQQLSFYDLFHAVKATCAS